MEELKAVIENWCCTRTQRKSASGASSVVLQGCVKTGHSNDAQ